MAAVTTILKLVTSFLILAGEVLFAIFLGKLYQDPGMFLSLNLITASAIRKDMWYFWLIVFFQLFTIVGLFSRSSLGGKFASMNTALSLFLVNYATQQFISGDKCDTSDFYDTTTCKYVGAGLAGAITLSFSQFLAVFVADGAAHEDARQDAKYHATA